MTKTVAAPAEKARMKLLKEMTPELKAFAKEGEERLAKTNSALMIVYYDLGSRLKRVLSNEAKYGTNAAEQLSAFWNIQGGATTLYHMKNVAARFDRDFIGEQSAKEMTDGGRLTFNHWVKIAQVKDEKFVEPLLRKTFSDSLSVRDLEAEIISIGAEKTTKRAAGAGRKQSVPKSPMAGLQKTFAAAQAFTNMVPVLEKNVFTAIDNMSPDNVDDTLLKRLNDTKEKLGTMRDGADSSIKHIERNITRVERVLAKKKEKEEKAETKTEGPAEAKSEKKGKGKKKGKKVKNKKKRKAVAAG